MSETKSKNAPPKKRGAPSLYTPQLAEKICALIEEGYSERKIATMPGMPHVTTITRWKTEHPDFCVQSARAREVSAELFNDRRMEKAQALYEDALRRAEAGIDFPKGVVEAIKASMQEDAREAAIRDDSRYGDRKTVAVETAQVGKGLKDFYDSLLKDLKDAEQ